MTNSKQVQIQFGRSANDYATSDVHARGESLSLLLELVQPRPDWNMLDVATGAGHTAIAFAPFVNSVVATDITEPMLRMTHRLAASRGLNNLRTQHADATQLPFGDASLDLVTCRLAFHHFPRPETAIREFVRVLKPGGILGFTDNVTVEDAIGAEIYNAYETLRDPSHFHVGSLSCLTTQLTDAGLSLITTQRLSKEFEFHEWADRQRVSDDDKLRLLEMLDSIPESLGPLLQPRKADGTVYFSLWEAVIIGRKND